MGEALTVILEDAVACQRAKHSVQSLPPYTAGPGQSFRSLGRVTQLIRNAELGHQVQTA